MTIVDCVSSLGGIELRTDDWQLDLLVAGPQKCLGGPPGMSLMAVSDAAWGPSRPTRRRRAPRSSRCSTGGRSGIGRATLPVHAVGRPTCTASRRAATSCSRRASRPRSRDTSAARACWAGIEAMGLRALARSEDIAAACVTAIAVPDGLTDIQVRDHCRERYGVQISGGQGAGNLVRLGHMGPTRDLVVPHRGAGARSGGRSPTSACR